MARSKPTPKKTSPSRGAAMDARSVRRLFGMARVLSSSLELDIVLKEIVNAIERVTGASGASLLLLDEEGRNLYFKTATGDKGEIVQEKLVPVEQGVAGWVVQHGKSVLVNDVASDERFSRSVDNASGFRTKSLIAVPFSLNGQCLGVMEAINKRGGSFTVQDLRALEELSHLAVISVENARAAENQKNFFINTLEILTAAIEATNPSYLGHPARVAEMACHIGSRLGVSGAAYRDLYHGALLHDVGMIALNHRRLLEQATSQDRNRDIARSHPLLGVELLKGIKLFRSVLPIVRHHHEHWDGTGHPDHLAGDQIPLGARIVCFLEEMEEIRFSGISEADLRTLQMQKAKNGSGTLFDPQVVDAFLVLSNDVLLSPPPQ